ncbi:MAG: hypothetical protein HYY21_00395 [Candidatus Tectomicrobia bacterium]|nr:hypothetical protein [Candidatus Tectomicrobia bacterium]
MAEAGKMILEVRVDVDPAHEEEFNRWYDQVHLPEIVDCPGFQRARRFVAVQGSPKYITLYDIDSEKALETPEFQSRRGWAHLKPYVKDPQVCTYRKITELEG